MKKRLLLPFIALACATFMAACAGGNKDEVKSEVPAPEKKTSYLDVLPSDACAIIKLDVDNLLDKSDVQKHKAVKGFFEKRLAGVPENIRPLLKIIYDNPDKSGIDVKSPIYSAITKVDFRNGVNPSRALVTIAISDVKALETAFSTILGAEFKTEEKNGMKYIHVDDFKVEIAYDANRIVVVVDETRARVADYLNLSPDAMAVNSKKYEQIFKGDEDVMVAVTLPPLTDVIMKSVGMAEFKAIADAMLADCAMYASLNFGKGSIDFELDSNIPDYITDVLNKYLKPSTKRHFEYIPQNCCAVLNFGIDLKRLDITPFAKMKNLSREEIMAINEILRKINGDLTVAVWTDGYNFEKQSNRQYLIALDCSDSLFFEALKALLGDGYGYELTAIDKDVYALNMNRKEVYNSYTYEYEYKNEGYDYYMMYKDGAVMFMPENLYDRLCYYTGKFGPLKDNISKNRTFASISNGIVVDPSPICEILSRRISHSQSEKDKMLLDVLSMFEKLTLEFKFFNIDASLKLNDGNTNSLKTIVKKILSLSEQADAAKQKRAEAM